MPRKTAPRRPRATRRTLPLVVATLAATLAVAACGASGPSQAPTSGEATGTASDPATSVAAATPLAAATGPSVAPIASPDPSDAPPTGLETPPFPSGSSAPPVVIDDSLAGILPTTVDGIAVQRAPDTEAAARSSTTLGADAEAFAAVEVLGADASDLAIASIVRLRSATPPDGFFASWRPSFDQAACAPAGGVSTTEIRAIGGRSVDTTLCVEGAAVYHLRLDDGRIVVSVLEAGMKGYGRALLEGAKG